LKAEEEIRRRTLVASIILQLSQGIIMQYYHTQIQTADQVRTIGKKERSVKIFISGGLTQHDGRIRLFKLNLIYSEEE